MKHHFVLVHGACHGAWCWYKLSTLLSSAGVRVTVLDMATSGIDPKRAEEIHSYSDYYKPLMEFMGSLPPEERVILVGHSLGGLGISLAMEKFPAKISLAVFVTAFMPAGPLPFLSINQKVASNFGMQEPGKHDSSLNQGHHSQPTYLFFSKEQLASQLYQLCPPEDLTLATKLVRPTAIFSDVNSLKEIVVSREKYRSVRRVFIEIKEDKAITRDIQKWMIENNPPDEVKEIIGADHMVMLSNPQKLFTCLLGIVENYNLSHNAHQISIHRNKEMANVCEDACMYAY